VHPKDAADIDDEHRAPIMISARARTALVVATPLVAFATVALGLRVGAGNDVRAAMVYSGPQPERDAPLRLQVHSLYEARGIRETAVVRELFVATRSGDREHFWRGTTNVEGVAEAELFDPRRLGDYEDALTITVRDGANGEVLANGLAIARSLNLKESLGAPGIVDASPARPTRREGVLALDVFVLGQRLVPGSPTLVFVHATDPRASADVTGLVVDAEAEQGAIVNTPHVTGCANGWAELSISAIGHLTALSFHVRANDGRTGEWYGPLVVATGPAVVSVPLRIAEYRPISSQAVAPPSRRLSYVEIDNDRGRVFAQSLSFTPNRDGTASAPIEIPSLVAGRYWMVTAHDARGAETLAPGSLARPFEVGVLEKFDRCADGPGLARAAATGFPRALILDGFVGKRIHTAAVRARGMTIAIASLAAAALLEVMVLVGGTFGAKAQLARAMAEIETLDRIDASKKQGRVVFDGRKIATPALFGTVLGVLLALLGFALLAAIVVYRAP
jgi:hypothetical protein